MRYNMHYDFLDSGLLQCANMKKLFSKIDNSSKDPNGFVGKQFTVGVTCVTVEDVIAEGKLQVEF